MHVAVDAGGLVGSGLCRGDGGESHLGLANDVTVLIECTEVVWQFHRKATVGSERAGVFRVAPRTLLRWDPFSGVASANHARQLAENGHGARCRVGERQLELMRATVTERHALPRQAVDG